MKLDPEYEQQVRDFLMQANQRFSRSEWINGKHVSCYMRRASRMLEGKHYSTLEIANVAVAEEMWNKGLYSALIALFEECAAGRAIFIESVPFHGNHDSIYLRRGYTKVDQNFYKLMATKQKRDLEKAWLAILAANSANLEKGAKAKAVVGKTKLSKMPKLTIPTERNSRTIASVDSGVGNAVQRKTLQYTGDKMVGISTLHKSNSVPVFSLEDAHDIAKMRR